MASPAVAIGMHWEIKDQSKHQRVSSRNRQQHCYPSQLGLHVQTTEFQLTDMFELTSNMDTLDVIIN
jgi:hypothetical protein